MCVSTEYARQAFRIDEDRSPEIQTYVENYMFNIEAGEASWIGDGTMYVGVKHLLPNHYLDFEEKRPIRYWPTCPLGALDIENASQKSAAMLENTMQAATNRFQLSMAVSSGWDSRCLLAATRKVRSKIYYYIQKYGGMRDSHPDIKSRVNWRRILALPFISSSAGTIGIIPSM